MHWLYVEVWSPLWPNSVAPSIWTLLGILLSHYKLRKHIHRNRAELKEHIDARLGEQDRKLRRGSERGDLRNLTLEMKGVVV